MIEQAEWIACGAEVEVPVIRKTLIADSPVSGEIEVTGLGYFTLFCNGRRVGRDYFVPAVSDYGPRDLSVLTYPLRDVTTHRIYYLRYDLTPFLKPGKNELAVELGNGFYRQRERTAEGKNDFGDRLCALFAVCIREADGTCRQWYSDGSETYTDTPIRYSQLYVGECLDLRTHPMPPRDVEKISCPAQLTLQDSPPDRRIRVIRPKLLAKRDGYLFCDAGENISGWVCVTVSDGGENDAVRLTFGEERRENEDAPDTDSSGGLYRCASGIPQVQTDLFYPGRGSAVLTPRYVWHAFRYFSVEGAVERIREMSVEVIHSDVAVTSSFVSDNATLCWLYEAYIRTELDNMHGGVPSDCPHRERLGYTGDGQVTSDAVMLLLDSRRFFEKWIRDIMDCQDLSTGHVQHTAPLMGGGGGPCGWGGAIIEVPYRYYLHFGGEALLRQWYPFMRRYVSYIKTRSQEGLVVREEAGGWCLGDWASMGPMQLPDPYVNSCLFVRQLRELTQIAEVMGCPEDAETYQGLAGQVSKALVEHYYQPETGSFCGGVQGADAYALDISLAPDGRTLANLVEKYTALDCFDTGFIGTDILIDVLLREGETNLAYTLLTQQEKGGYGWMQRRGATTLYEYPDGRESHCHPMFGAPVRQLFRRFLGIGWRGIPGREDYCLEICPQIPDAANFMKGSVTVPAGKIAVGWRRCTGTAPCGIELTVEVPSGVRAELIYRGKKVSLSPGKNRFFPEDPDALATCGRSDEATRTE